MTDSNATLPHTYYSVIKNKIKTTYLDPTRKKKKKKDDAATFIFSLKINQILPQRKKQSSNI
jgi:hypothetical protein